MYVDPVYQEISRTINESFAQMGAPIVEKVGFMNVVSGKHNFLSVE
jgi:hypothetical protein